MAEENCTHDCSSCGENCASRQAPQFETPHPKSRIGHIIGVISGVILAELISNMMQIPVSISAPAIIVAGYEHNG